MATPFAFLPRAVSKHQKPWQGISRPPDPTTDSESDASDEDDSNITVPSSLDKPKGKEKAIEPAQSKQSTIAQDIASLISLALSDYNIWLDADLCWKLDACLEDETEAGFIPINYLLRRTPFRGSLPLTVGQPEPSETEVVKALRTHASHTLEVRIRLPSASSAPSSSVWYGTGKTSRKKDVGGYEVRRRDWPTLRDRPSRGWTRTRWDEMTVYMECIPPQYRTVGGIARFAETLLPLPLESDPDAEPRFRIQNVTLPPHYLDKPGDMSKCKGHALVTFSTKSQVETILGAWPWKRHRTSDGAGAGNALPVVMEAHKYGLRAISKARWDALNEEYLLYKQHLVDEIARTQIRMHHPSEDATAHERGEPTTFSPPSPQTETETRARTTPSSPYPFDCLVFARNVHPETNKTTLKSLFTQAFQDKSEQGQTTAGLDYVDFNKGTDTCYLRLASPNHATCLMEYFDVRRKTQAHGLDATGRTPVQDDKSIVVETIQGKKEELYWEKVPEKVRRQAVDKAVKSQLASIPGVESSASSATCRNGAHRSGQGKQIREP